MRARVSERIRWVAAVAAAILAGARPSPAQGVRVPPAGAASAASASPVSSYAVSGVVLSVDDDPIANAEVRIEGAAHTVLRIVQSDAAGRFSVLRLSAVPVRVRVRAFGYAPADAAVRVGAATGAASVTFHLDPVAAALTGVPVNAAAPDSDEKLAPFRERRASNHFAHFIDGDEIERRKPQFVSEMLRSVGGVTLIASDKLGNVLRIRGCAPLVWVDGVRMPGAQLDEVAPAGDVAGIEIYNSFAGIPARYFDRTATCGTILVWLRS